YFILHKQKKVTRSPQGSENVHRRERECLHSEEATPWIPASAGMTAAAALATARSRMTSKPCQSWLSSRLQINPAPDPQSKIRFFAAACA
ncbi:MAG: hypothetical protein WCR74_10330, partial [Betaproteobacteria bacterium]